MPTDPPEYTRNFADVYLAELDYVKKRRDEMGISSESVLAEIEHVRNLKAQTETDVSESERPNLNVTSSQAGLVGLALSGGGVRSATFNLGLLQSLAKNKVLQSCDYLSTVSGGGYIGSCLSSLLGDNKDYSTKKEAFPFRETDSKTLGERPEVNHLRATKNYLGLGGGVFSLDIWHMIGTTISGLLLMSIIPLALILSTILLLYFIPPFEESFIPTVLWYELALKLEIVFVSALFIWMVVIRFRLASPLGFNEESHIRHNKRIALRAAIVNLLIMGSMVIGLIYWLAWTYAGQQQIFVYLLMISLLVILAGFLSSSNNKFQQTLVKVIMFLALGVFVCSFFAWLLSVGYASERLKQFERMIAKIDEAAPEPIQSEYLKENLFMIEVYSMAMSDIQTNQKWWINWFQEDILYEKLETPEKASEAEKKVANEAAEQAVKEVMFLLNIQQLIQTYGLIDVINRLRSVANASEISSTSKIQQLIDEYEYQQTAGLITVMQQVQQETWAIKVANAKPIGIAIVILLVIGLLININRNSLHYFYRDRLSKTYMIKCKQNQIESNSSVLLQELHKCYNSPYHLINTTLNVPYSKNPSLSGRGADFFIFSKHYCGAEVTGYRSTASYNQGKTKVATAMAISGAAASPEMGTRTNPLMVIVMTLLNTRLNLWMPNPKHQQPPKFTFWPKYLLNELFRKGTENDTLINLSDGGHHENLGIYPLLKRRCRVIIASDAGADPKFQMNDIANLQRKARIDLGINISIDMTDLRPNPNNNGYTKAHFIKGTIQYPDDEPGTLLYIKTTLTGAEPEDLLAYRRIHPSFPDETTADQFFNEEQFESYRKLGELSGDEVFPKEEEVKTIFGISALGHSMENSSMGNGSKSPVLIIIRKVTHVTR